MSERDELPAVLALRLAAPISQDAAATALAGHECWRWRVAELLDLTDLYLDLTDGQLYNRLRRRLEGVENKSTDPVIDPTPPEHVWERLLDWAGDLEVERFGSDRAADLRHLLAEVERLRRENALLRRGDR